MVVSLAKDDNNTTAESVFLNGETLDTIHSYNCLGVVIDDVLSFNNFFKKKCNKVIARIYQFGKLRKYITSTNACLIYKQTILPISEYADL